jgi:hypothetical protein
MSMTEKHKTILNALSLVPRQRGVIQYIEQTFGHESALLELDQTTDTTTVEIPGLAVPLEPNILYEITLMLRILTSSDADGIVYGLHFTGSGTPTLCIAIIGTDTAPDVLTSPTALVALDTPTITVLTFADGEGILLGHGWLQNGDGKGDLTVLHAKAVGGLATCKKGSFIRRRKLV